MRDNILLIAGLESVFHEGNAKKGNSILSDKLFQMDENMPKQERNLGIGFLNAPTINISYGMKVDYTAM